MKIFVYKALFIFVCIFLLFQLTIGVKIKQFERELDNFKSKENIENIKNKIRKELRNAVEKENYLSDDDAKLINEFINKLKQELSN
jgi:uncharacterized protein YlxW (UPF0749 family)|tara:strand:+ start:281 stop:538 length:258 start_codon:yes stop_codon:yes gene_type:complete